MQLAIARGATVVATAGPSSEAGVRDYGARVYSTITIPSGRPACETHLRADMESQAAVYAARGDAATALQAVANEGRLATITGDPPPPERGITVANVYVRADGARLAALVAALADGLLSLQLAATLPLAQTATALQGRRRRPRRRSDGPHCSSRAWSTC